MAERCLYQMAAALRATESVQFLGVTMLPEHGINGLSVILWPHRSYSGVVGVNDLRYLHPLLR